MALRRPPTTFSDEITAGDLAANSVGASELADDAVDTAAIADGAVDADRLAANAVTTAKILNANVTTDKVADANITTAKVADNAVTSAKVATATFTDNIEVKPHIIPGMLYPAVAGNKLDGTATANSTTGPAGSTITSSRYGTVQSDGRMYYYTDVIGSKPIKDPRIGSHFGSQRHMFKSLQRRENETNTGSQASGLTGSNSAVYSIDGRDWLRAIGDWKVKDDSHGEHIGWYKNTQTQDANYIECVGYFNDINFLCFHWSDTDNLRVFLDGGTVQGNNAGSANAQPTQGRYQDEGKLNQLEFNGGRPSLGIHTVKISWATGDLQLCSGIELIVHDVTSATTRNQIQIQPQNVVSYGKKFAVAKTEHHYNPFAYAQDGTTAVAIGDNASHGKLTGGWASGGTTAQHYDSTLDTATSLGLAAWVNGGNYYRPVNGGRVVKWIDSTGAIKTSVNMMPPSAKAWGSHSGNAGPHQTAWTSTWLPVFSSGAIDHSQSEVAKQYFFRELGNGSGNQGANGTLADFSALKDGTPDRIGYILDDGVTAAVAHTVEADTDQMSYRFNANNTPLHFTFIGTGLTTWFKIEASSTHGGSDNVVWSIDGVTTKTFTSGVGFAEFETVCQNLPYDTHVLKVYRGAVSHVHQFYKGWTIHQPKMPPIPEDACVIADYMLMADYVKSTNTTQKIEDISKGVRLQTAGRDMFSQRTGGSWDGMNPSSYASDIITGSIVGGGNYSDWVAKLPFFGFTKGAVFARRITDAHDIEVQCTGSAGTVASIATTNVTVSTRVIPALSGAIADCSGGSTAYGAFNWARSDGVLGRNQVQLHDANLTSTFDWSYIAAFEIVTPIHTSSHYQPFESPKTRNLVGGDRNMEQTNLVVTADGKTWDEHTRDHKYQNSTAYVSVIASANEASWTGNGSTAAQWDWVQGYYGTSASDRPCWYKGWAPAYDRMVCLEEGAYVFLIQWMIMNSSQGDSYFKKNGSTVNTVHPTNVSNAHDMALVHYTDWHVKYGDYFQLYAQFHGNQYSPHFTIIKLNDR